MKSTKTNSPTGSSRATSLPPKGNTFLYIETSSNNHGNNVVVSFERTDTIQISYITFYYNRFSFLIDNSKKQLVIFEFNCYNKIILGVLDITYLKMIDILIHQLTDLN